MLYFETKKNIFLNKAKAQLLWFEYKDEFHKELDLLVCWTILRYCVEQGFIKDQKIKKSMNSIIHASMYVVVKDWTILIKSEYEHNKGKKWIKVNKSFINTTIKCIDKALIEKLKIVKDWYNEYLKF